MCCRGQAIAVLLMPLTAETTNVMDARRLALMPKGRSDHQPRTRAA